MTEIDWNASDQIAYQFNAHCEAWLTGQTGAAYHLAAFAAGSRHEIIDALRTTKPDNAASPELVESLRSMRDHFDLARNRIRATAINYSSLDEPRAHEASYWAKEADEHVNQFDAILAELEPVDPDLELAREVVASDENWFGQRTLIREGKYDDNCPVAIALDAIKRVRAEKG